MICFDGPGLGVRDLGIIAYPEALALQHRLVEERRAGIVSDLLLLCGHPAVITRGRGTPSDEPVPAGIAVVDAERGGELTWHGPGQLVGYPIIDLEPRGRDVRAHLRNVEEVMIRTLTAFGLTGTRREGCTGVWIGDRKIASVGVAVRRWVAYHGFALNVDSDLDVYRRFRPCGLDGSVMTSMAAERGSALRGGDVRRAAAAVAQEVFSGSSIHEPQAPVSQKVLDTSDRTN